jgi:hypothetical protein
MLEVPVRGRHGGSRKAAFGYHADRPEHSILKGGMHDDRTVLQLARRHAAYSFRLVDEQSARIARTDPNGALIRPGTERLETLKATLAVFWADLAHSEKTSPEIR